MFEKVCRIPLLNYSFRRTMSMKPSALGNDDGFESGPVNGSD